MRLTTGRYFCRHAAGFLSLIVGVGFQKTGTSSLRDALRTLGYRVGDNNHQVLWPYLHGNMGRVLRKLQQFDAVEDNPWPLMYKDLDALVPGSKFILTVRDPERWFESVARHIGDLRDPMHEWIYGRKKPPQGRQGPHPRRLQPAQRSGDGPLQRPPKRPARGRLHPGCRMGRTVRVSRTSRA